MDKVEGITEEPSLLHVFLIGFCCDAGAAACESRTGAEKGPECLRHLMKSYQLAWFEEEKAKVRLWDCGDATHGQELQEKIAIISS
jgi:arginase family enzyme